MPLLFLFAPLAPACSGGGSQETSSSASASSGSGGSGGSGGSSACPPDFASLQQQVLLRSCGQRGCHEATNPAVGLNLATGDVAARLVGVPSSSCDGKTRVVPGSPETSFLYEKITQATPACGAHMPIGDDLPPSDIACIQQWIAGLSASGSGGGGSGGAGGGSGGGSAGCTGGLTECNGACVDTSSDPNNCGGCGKTPCAANEVCKQGVCSASCGALTQCGGACVDTKTDPNNCGGCGKACAVGQTCAGGTCSCGSASVSFSAAVQPIFTASCAQNGCHGNTMPQQGLNLSAGKAYQAIVNVAATECADGRKRVLPGQPDQSYLIDKMQGVDLCSGTKMPKFGVLPAGDLQTIGEWICAGAPNN